MTWCKMMTDTTTNTLHWQTVTLCMCTQFATMRLHLTPVYQFTSSLWYCATLLYDINWIITDTNCCWCSLTDKQGPTRPSVCWCTVKWYWSPWVEYTPFGGSSRLTTEIIPQTATLPKVFMFASTVPNHSPPTYVHARISTEIYYSIRVYAS